MKKKLKAIEKAMTAWTLENPRQWRVISTLVFALSLWVQVRGFRESDGWMQVVSALLAIALIGIYAMLLFQWRRFDLLEEMRLLVGEQTDDLAILGNVAWNWGYRTPTKDVREIVAWLRTHDVARTSPDDMPQPVRTLVGVLAEAL